MNTEALANTRIGRLVVRLLAAVMESRLRYRFFGPEEVLRGAGIHPGMTVLEIGCGTGFFTLPAALLLGEQGSLVAMDRMSLSVEAVAAKVRQACLTNTRVVVGDALDTQLETESFDAVLIFGVIPAPMLPMDGLLREVHRILKPGGTMAVWPPSWVHRSIRSSGIFAYSGMRHGVMNYMRTACDPE